MPICATPAPSPSCPVRDTVQFSCRTLRLILGWADICPCHRAELWLPAWGQCWPVPWSCCPTGTCGHCGFANRPVVTQGGRDRAASPPCQRWAAAGGCSLWPWLAHSASVPVLVTAEPTCFKIIIFLFCFFFFLSA